MKFFKIFIVLTLLLVLLIPNFGFNKKRNLSTPLSRLIGHWQDSNGFEYYFSPADRSTMTGSLVRVIPNKEKLMKAFPGQIDKHDTKLFGRATYCQYKILSQVPKGKEVKIAMLWPPEDFNFPLPKEMTFNIERNGKHMQMLLKRTDMTLEYIDSKTSPEDK